MKFGVNSKKFVLGSYRSHPWGEGYPLRQRFGKPYSTAPHDLKSVLWFKGYSIFSTKLVLKPQGVNLGFFLKSLWEILISMICRHKIEPDL